MKNIILELARWIAVLLFAVAGVWMLIVVGYPALSGNSGLMEGLFGTFLTALVAGPPLLAAYALYRRGFRALIGLCGTIAGIAVFFALSALPRRLGLYDHPMEPQADKPWLVLIQLALALLFLVGPFVAAAWTFRLFRRLENWFDQRADLRAGRRLP